MISCLRNSKNIIISIPLSRFIGKKHRHHYSTMEKYYVLPCLDSFKKTLEEINPTSCVQKTLCLEGNQLIVENCKYLLRKNVYLIAIGKAAIGMIRGAEQVLAQHLISGIASVPDETKMPDEKLQTRILYGAKDNLPDERALSNSQQIEEFINKIITRAGEKAEEQILLFLISGGGSALLPAPIPGITLKEKLYLIQLLQHNGADIQQLNILRTALSRLKGGGLAKIAYPTKMISLIISDIVGDPIELISSGPTVIPNKTHLSNPIGVLKELGILDKVNDNILNALKRAATKREEDFKKNNQNIDVQNVIVASNTKMLEALAKKLADSNFLPLIITNKLEGNASSRGKEMANLVINLTEENTLENELAKKLLFNVETISKLEECLIGQTQPIVLLFGGETTVIFNQDKVQKGAKGGRNQELVLAAFQVLLTHKKEKSRFKKEFLIFSLGTDGQDGPTDATGAYISSDELSNQDSMLCSKINDHLEGKNSYGFWNAFNGGQNLIKYGKTGMNVMDIQMIVLLP